MAKDQMEGQIGFAPEALGKDIESSRVDLELARKHRAAIDKKRKELVERFPERMAPKLDASTEEERLRFATVGPIEHEYNPPYFVIFSPVTGEVAMTNPRITEGKHVTTPDYEHRKPASAKQLNASITPIMQVLDGIGSRYSSSISLEPSK